jgi:hypothetical protein
MKKLVAPSVFLLMMRRKRRRKRRRRKIRMTRNHLG